MGLRFKKSIKIAPGVKVNLNKKSASISVGTRGARLTTNTKGKTTASAGIPGTGLSYSKTSSSKTKRSSEIKASQGKAKSVSAPKKMTRTQKDDILMNHLSKEQVQARLEKYKILIPLFYIISLGIYFLVIPQIGFILTAATICVHINARKYKRILPKYYEDNSEIR